MIQSLNPQLCSMESHYERKSWCVKKNGDFAVQCVCFIFTRFAEIFSSLFCFDKRVRDRTDGWMRREEKKNTVLLLEAHKQMVSFISDRKPSLEVRSPAALKLRTNANRHESRSVGHSRYSPGVLLLPVPAQRRERERQILLTEQVTSERRADDHRWPIAGKKPLSSRIWDHHIWNLLELDALKSTGHENTSETTTSSLIHW